jgi:hypothetical protein
MDDLRELAGELRERWNDGYFWADHQVLQAVIAAVALGLIGLAFKWLELRMVQAMEAPAP